MVVDDGGRWNIEYKLLGIHLVDVSKLNTTKNVYGYIFRTIKASSGRYRLA